MKCTNLNVNNLYEENLKLAYHTAHRVCRYYGCRFDEDIEQEALIHLWKASEEFDPSRGHQFSTLAVTAIWRGVARWVQNQSKQRNGWVDTEFEPGHEPEVENMDVIESVEREEVESWIAFVPGPLREDVRLFFIGGLNTVDIGKRTGLTHQRVQQRLKEALRHIRKAMIETGVQVPAREPESREGILLRRAS